MNFQNMRMMCWLTLFPVVETGSESQEKQAEYGIWQWWGVTDEFGHVSVQKEQRNQIGVRERQIEKWFC